MVSLSLKCLRQLSKYTLVPFVVDCSDSLLHYFLSIHFVVLSQSIVLHTYNARSTISCSLSVAEQPQLAEVKNKKKIRLDVKNNSYCYISYLICLQFCCWKTLETSVSSQSRSNKHAKTKFSSINCFGNPILETDSGIEIQQPFYTPRVTCFSFSQKPNTTFVAVKSETSGSKLTLAAAFFSAAVQGILASELIALFQTRSGKSFLMWFPINSILHALQNRGRGNVIKNVKDRNIFFFFFFIPTVKLHSKHRVCFPICKQTPSL